MSADLLYRGDELRSVLLGEPLALRRRCIRARDDLVPDVSIGLCMLRCDRSGSDYPNAQFAASRKFRSNLDAANRSVSEACHNLLLPITFISLPALYAWRGKNPDSEVLCDCAATHLTLRRNRSA